jgi:hypothetical protein
MGDFIYKLPLDDQTDNDLITWINSLPRNKKAELVRHALRFYKSHLKEGEVFIMPSPSGAVSQESSAVDTGTKTEERESNGKKKRPNAGILTGITKTE